MNVIKSKTIFSYGKIFPDAKESLNVWLVLMEMHNFQHLPDLRKVFPSADPVGSKKN
jgi:mRNA-degrading endonuclease HigB of HigAB toxin-antitoxin module